MKLALIATVAFTLGMLPAQAAYPEKPITLVIPFPQGGSTGFTAKVLAEQLQKILKQPVTLLEKPGNFGITAIDEIRGKTDGYTLMVGSIITNSMTPIMHKEKFTFDYDREIVPISMLATFPSVFMTRLNNPANTVKELLENLKKTSGKMTIGIDFPGTYSEADFVTLAKTADLKVTVRLSNGALAILNNIVEGRIDVSMLNVATSTANKGKFKPLAVSSTRRLSNFPDVPTMAESGYPQIGTNNWQGLFAARGTPQDVIDALHKAVVQAMNTPEAKEAFTKVDAEAVTSASPAQLAQHMRDEMVKWERLRPEVMGLPIEP